MPSCGITFLPSIMKIGKSVDGILRFCFKNLKGCNIGITDEEDQ
jgi:hypothetical protein